MTTKPAEANGSPESYGYKLDGNCYDVLKGKGLQCDEQTVRTVEGQPGGWLSDALELGVVKYVCETPDGMRQEFSLSRVVQRN